MSILNERKLKIVCDRIIGYGLIFALIILQGIFPRRYPMLEIEIEIET